MRAYLPSSLTVKGTEAASGARLSNIFTKITGEDDVLRVIETSIRIQHFSCRYDAEWFMKTDDDTYVVVDNLRLVKVGFLSICSIYIDP